MTKKPKRFDLLFDFDNFSKNNLKEKGKHYELVKTFFYDLITGFHAKSSDLEEKLYSVTKEHFLPQILLERNQYSLFAAALASMTPIHLSEWGISCAKGEKKRRRIDLWCLYLENETNQKVNFFIELKRNDYCLSENSKPTISSKSAKALKDLENQLRNLRSNPIKWAGDGEYYFGIMVTTCWLGKGASQGYYVEEAKNAILNVIHGNSKTHVMQAHFELDDDYPTQDIYDENGEKCDEYYKTKYVIFTGLLVEP